MTLKQFSIISILVMSSPFYGMADEYPTITPMAYITTDDGEEEVTTYSGSAPLEVRLVSGAVNTEGWDGHYEWHFTMEDETNTYLVRYEEETTVTLTTAGSHRIELYATFTRGDESVEYTEEYWSYTDPIRITISESKLEMPNAFSPNGDGINDIYKPKEGWQSLVEFKASIYNRWGQKLYEWTDPDEGWDGTYNGRDAKQGVYFVVVKAKGSDGRNYNIRRDVNLLRGYTEDSSTTTE